MRAHAAARRRMPPVLHVPFAELARGGAQQMLAQQRRLGMHQGHRVLQLVAEAERAARLVKSRARPHAAGERLVDQPAVGQEVDGADRAFRRRPRRASGSSNARRLRARRAAGARSAETLHELSALSPLSAPTPSMKTNFPLLAVVEREGDLHAPRTDRAPRRRGPERRTRRMAAGSGRRAVAAEELGAIAGEGSRRLSLQSTERDASRKIRSCRRCARRARRCSGRSRSPRA